MKRVFDIANAQFEPEQVARLQEAYQLASKALSREQPLSTEVERKIGKMLVSLARQEIRKRDDLDPEAIAGETARMIEQLLAMGLLR